VVQSHPPAGEKGAGKSAPNPLSILVAEDNPVNEKVLRSMLKQLGYWADFVHNGAEAVEAARSIPYGVILMDCQMPEMDGYDATRRIREEEECDGRHTCIVAITANALAGDRERCLAAGMDCYLAKPVRRDALARLLENCSRGGTLFQG